MLKCGSCGFITANYDMDHFDSEKIYDESYFNGSEYENYVRDKDVFLENYDQRIEFLKKKDKERLFSTVLEIGCAYGFFGLALRKHFPAAHYKGIDVTKEAVHFGSTQFGLDLVCEDYLQHYRDQPITDIFMWDVIEHLPHPDLFVQKIHQDLGAQGRLYLTTGDISALVPRFQGKNWRMIHPPSHLHYFSKKTISLLLKRYGFKIVSISYPSVSRSLRQIYYSLFLLKREGNSFHRMVHSAIPGGLKIPVNTFDIMMVVAEKE
ncbi:MAG: class I SAM-dependent methyltransferase [Cyclobacteriaceae bacterium]|nr:class I SAM-dependent methyltransferase [Cyclobacteriaceae bacterium]